MLFPLTEILFLPIFAWYAPSLASLFKIVNHLLSLAFPVPIPCFICLRINYHPQHTIYFAHSVNMSPSPDHQLHKGRDLFSSLCPQSQAQGQKHSNKLSKLSPPPPIPLSRRQV